MPSTNSAIFSIEDARSADLRRERGNASLHEGVVQHTRIDRIVKDLADGIQLQHRPDGRHAHFPDIECRDLETCCSRVEVDRAVGVGAQQAVEYQPACRLAAVRPFSLPGHSRFMSIRSMPRPELGQRRCMLSNAGRDTSVTAITVPDIAAGSSWFITVWTAWTELISSPCTPLTRMTRLPGLTPRATVTDTCQCCPVGVCDAAEIQEVLLARLQVVHVQRSDDLLSPEGHRRHRSSLMAGWPPMWPCLRHEPRRR